MHTIAISKAVLQEWGFSELYTLNYDGIGTNVINQFATNTVKSITHLINVCLQGGIFPDVFKPVKIVPSYKKGDKTLFQNYRQIHVLFGFSRSLHIWNFWYYYEFSDNILIDNYRY